MSALSEPDRPASFIAVGMIRDADAMARYARKATPLLEAAGGIVAARHQVRSSIEGADAPAIVFVMRFESEAALRAVFSSDAYRALVPERDRAFSRLDLWIADAD